MLKEGGHHLAALDFLNTYQGVKGRITHVSPSVSGVSNTADKWYESNGVMVRGLVSGAILVVDWWLLLGEPVENYTFKWKSSGRYEVSYTDEEGRPVMMMIDRNSLLKYPDLVKRFDALRPLDVKFSIQWRIGGHTDQHREKFRKQYRIMGDIGSAMPHVKSEFNTTVNNGLLFEPSGVEPLSVPSIRPGKGREFFGLKSDYSEARLREILAYWDISKGHVINGFSITSMRWPTGEMKEIARKFMKYERGEVTKSPMDSVKEAQNRINGLSAFQGDEFWSGAQADEIAGDVKVVKDNGYYVLKTENRILLTIPMSECKYLWKISNKLFYMEGLDQVKYIINHRGHKVLSGFNSYQYDAKTGELAVMDLLSEQRIGKFEKEPDDYGSPLENYYFSGLYKTASEIDAIAESARRNTREYEEKQAAKRREQSSGSEEGRYYLSFDRSVTLKKNEVRVRVFNSNMREIRSIQAYSIY